LSFICSKEGGKEKAPAKSGGGRRRKWSKGKQKEKVNNAVLFDQATTYDKLLSEVIYLSSCSLYYVLCWLRCLSMSGISEQEHLRLSSCNVAVIGWTIIKQQHEFLILMQEEILSFVTDFPNSLSVGKAYAISELKMMLILLFQKSIQAWLLVEGMHLYLMLFILCSVPACLIPNSVI